MSSKEPENTLRENNFGERPPEFDYSAEDFGEPVQLRRSLLLMRVLIVVINLAAIIFCRSFIQSWYSVHGTTPLWIPIIFLLVPLGSLFFIYFYMGRIGFERIIKLICLAFCALHIINFFSPVDSSQITLGTEGYSSDYSYVTQAGNLLGIAFPKEGSATTTDSITSDFESSKVKLFDKIKSFLAQEKLYSCTEVIYTDDQAEELDGLLRTARGHGVQQALVGNMGHIFYARRAGMQLRGDFGLNVFNSYTEELLRQAGFLSVTASFELRMAQIRDLAKAVDTEMIVYGRLPCMITEQCVIRNSAGRCNCHIQNNLTDRRGSAFPVVRAFGCRNVIYNAHKLYLADKREDYESAGLWGVRLLFTTETPRECVEVAKSYLGLTDYRPNGLTRGLYYRGVE